VAELLVENPVLKKSASHQPGGSVRELSASYERTSQAARDLDVGSSLKIQAFAGTGKTTTLAAIAESLARAA
jgi:ABC-type phosphonate transport system ATPase subunit